MSINIKRLEADRLAGVGRLFFLPVAALLDTPAVAGGAVIGELELVPGFNFAELESQVHTATLDTKGEQTVHGQLFTHQAAGFFAGDSDAVARLFTAMAGRRYVVLVRDHNGVSRLAGADRSGLQFQYNFQTGKVPRERKGYAWSFTGASPVPALIYANEIPTLDEAGQLPPAGPGAGSGSVQVFNRAGQLLRTVPAGRKLILTSGFKIYTRVE